MTCRPPTCLPARPRIARYLPQEGILELCFVDLRPVSKSVVSLSRPQFAVLLSMLVNMPRIDPVQVLRTIKEPGREEGGRLAVRA